MLYLRYITNDWVSYLSGTNKTGYCPTGVVLTIDDVQYAVFIGGFDANGNAKNNIVVAIVNNGSITDYATTLNTARFNAVATQTTNVDGTNAILITGGYTSKTMTTSVTTAEVLTYTKSSDGNLTFTCTPIANYTST